MILTINAGSSSLRFSLFNTDLKLIYKGHVDAIGRDNCKYRRYLESGQEIRTAIYAANHQAAITFALHRLKEDGVIDDLKKIKKVGHRVVHGGESFTKPTKLTDATIKKIRLLSPLAPLHNPANLEGIKSAKKHLAKATHYAIFDTAFHATLPEKAYLYGLPYSLYKKEGIRRYGFHGTSHQYVANEATQLLKKKHTKLITCHMGNGVSIAAIKDGICLDTSMGFTPLEGPVMGTRSGSFDPAIIFHLAKKRTLKQIENLVQKESGYKGLSEISSDIRDLRDQINSPETQRTFGVFAYQMAKLILGYTATIGGKPDAIVFTAGVGEHAEYLRRAICDQLNILGIKLSKSKNHDHALEISTAASQVKVFVIPTNEELQMAREIILL
ncbi:MAG: acetate kinase [Oceanicoccus sp.]|jgi:acetate kinase